MPGGEQRPAVLARPHPQRGEVGDRAVERAAQALPAAANPRHAQRPGGDDVARALALLVELLERLELLVEPRADVDRELPALVRLERERRTSCALPSSRPGFEKTSCVPRSPRGSTIESWRPCLVVGSPAPAAAAACARSGIAEREVVQLHRDDVREVGLGLERDLDLEPLGALVPERDPLLHARADEPLAGDRERVARQARRRRVAEVEGRREVLDAARGEEQRRWRRRP